MRSAARCTSKSRASRPTASCPETPPTSCSPARVASLWMHGGLLMLGGARMAKSAGNFFRVTELEEQGFDPLAFRYLALQAKYRTKLNFSVEGLAGADRALSQLREKS